jgi:hypothetical protein
VRSPSPVLLVAKKYDNKNVHVLLTINEDIKLQTINFMNVIMIIIILLSIEMVFLWVGVVQMYLFQTSLKVREFCKPLALENSAAYSSP